MAAPRLGKATFPFGSQHGLARPEEGTTLEGLQFSTSRIHAKRRQIGDGVARSSGNPRIEPVSRSSALPLLSFLQRNCNLSRAGPPIREVNRISHSATPTPALIDCDSGMVDDFQKRNHPLASGRASTCSMSGASYPTRQSAHWRMAFQYQAQQRGYATNVSSAVGRGILLLATLAWQRRINSS